MTTTLTLGERGEVILAKDVLDHLGVKPGATLAIDLDPAGRISIRAAEGSAPGNEAPRSGRIEDTFGMLKQYYDGPPLTIDEINEAIADGWAGKR
ncbi:AbrB/MazE/SpoVT family DNA-binding domain-containing protein [Jiella sonneratiae]|uniref:AbrB/MazE/SpoVT family DNA-binding domain-containing protein n=1 Tax=Jiella sonneratiae TaxID=2816856 RepID=A0ABS3J7L7_9HYPH|nr:AbrB/MazE/SpoVT family DNA-binding domain-containing protein [Jiella sonneratiae]MBO0905668.1 AbrB/MazE/SpoVT family DNA-binding domain-containing protein [Jiella sonneratiae]